MHRMRYDDVWFVIHVEHGWNHGCNFDRRGRSIYCWDSIYKKPESLSKWSVAVLVSSIVGLVSMSGFFIGPVLGIIGGILALTKN